MPIENLYGSFNLNSGAITGATPTGLNFDLPLSALAAFQNNALDFMSRNTAQTQGFLGGVISGQQSAVSRVADQTNALNTTIANNFNQQRMFELVVQKKSASYGYDLGKRSMLKPGSMCFITTAVCEYSGKADDCDELQTLRKWRDEKLNRTAFGKKLIAQYYNEAPGIVEALQAKERAPEIFAMLNSAFIAPAIQFVKAGDDLAALDTYCALFDTAKRLAEE